MPGILEKLQLEGTEIIDAEWITAGEFIAPQGHIHRDLPKFYRVLLRSAPGSGSLIHTEIWLPEQWNGIFLGTGNGGMAGEISYWPLAQYVRQGYVVANTDLGTSRGRSSGIRNPDVWKDFGWRATHIMTELGKQVLHAFYGEKEKFSYFVGGSTGGQQAFSEAQRFPLDYDGILAGVPANNRLFLHTYFLWNHVHLATSDGGGRFSEAEIQAVNDCAVCFFQLRGDGEPGDAFVSFPHPDENTVGDFLAFLRQRQPDLTDAQIDALRAVYRGPWNPATGEQIYNGMPIGSEIYDCGIRDCQGGESPYFFPFIWAFGEDYSGFDFNFASDMDRISDILSADLNANSENLEAFCAHGGRLIAYSGSADACVPYPDAMEYYNRVAKKMGGYKKTGAFFRFFLLPGKDHGHTGRGANAWWGSADGREDLLTVLRNWREKEKVPESIVAARVEGNAEQENIIFARTIPSYKADRSPGRDFPAVCAARYLNAK